MDIDNDFLLDKTSFYQQGELTESSPNPPQAHAAASNSPQLDFIDFLAVAQWRNIDFLPITWQQMLSSIGVGGTARMKQSIVNNQVNLAFKRLHLEKTTAESRAITLQAVMTEVSVLGHSVVRGIPYFIRVEGVCWDFTDDGVWPVLVFRKADHGNLREFLWSEEGGAITLAQRLQICSEIGSAIMTMHAFHMIHGDLKPENVLIFNDESGGYVAKVADFGYSGISVERAEDSKFHLPISRPWNAPEVTEWSSVLVLGAARQADIYSFGLLCLWTLFHDRFPAPGEECNDATDDLDWIQRLKDNNLLFSFAMECMENTERLSEEDIEGLVLFFSWTLATEPLSRQLPNEARTAAESMFFKQKNAEPFPTFEDEAAFQNKLGALSSIGIQCKDLEGHTKPFGFLHYYSSQIGPHDLGYNTDRKRFKLADAIPPFVASDYRLWAYLRECYEARQNDSHRESASKNDAAFQLALLCSLQLGMSNENDESSTWLLKSGRPNRDLEFEIDRLRSVKAITFRSTDVEIDFIDFVDHYRELGLLAKAQEEYESIANHFERLFGSSHALVIRLRMFNVKALQDQGQLQKAEEAQVDIVATTESNLGEDSPSTVAAKLQLVSIYIDISSWHKAETLQKDVLKTSIRAFGEDSEQAQISMGNLGVIYWNLRQLDRAEELQSQHLAFLQRTRGKRHKKTLITMNNLSSTYEYQGRADDALKLKLEVLGISKEINREEHHFTISIMTNIANNYRRQQRFKDAEELEIKIVAARKRQLGEDHLVTLRAISNLASTYALQGRPREAEPLERHVVSSLTIQLDPLHQDLLTARNNLSHTLKDLGEIDEAIQIMTDVVAGRTEVLGPHHPETKRSAGNLQLWLRMTAC